MTRFRLIGDHSHYHCGSAAAFAAVSAEVARHGQIVDDDEFDVLVVNGEGTMHHNSRGCRRKLETIAKALSAGRQVHLINTVWEDNPPDYIETLQGCRSVVAREVLSARALARQGVAATVRLDQAYFCPLDEVAEPEDFAGATLCTDFFSREFGTFVRITGKWGESYPYIDMRAWDWSRLVASFRNASMLVTGRHHAVYAACRARLPFLALEGNTHKIRGMIETSGIPIPIFTEFSELKTRLRWVDEHRALYQELFDWMEQQPRWCLGD